MAPRDRVTAFAPGRVNLIGDHTDHTGGLCLPMALTLGVRVRGVRTGDRLALTSPGFDDVDLPVDVDVSSLPPGWGRYVAAVAREVAPSTGLRGAVESDLPVGAGLSSSAALEVAVALALGATTEPLGLARLCRRAEHLASGVPCGLLDQLTATSGVEGHALLMDCHDERTTPVLLPDTLEVVVVHSGQERTLATSAYAERVTETRAAEQRIGPLRRATPGDVEGIEDPVIRRRARHVVSENRRVREAVLALEDGDVARFGVLLDESHRSLRDDFECSTPTVDELVERLRRRPGVLGARMTGGGWGGCVVAVAEAGALDEGWVVTAGGPARVTRGDGPSVPRTRRR